MRLAQHLFQADLGTLENRRDGMLGMAVLPKDVPATIGEIKTATDSLCRSDVLPRLRVAAQELAELLEREITENPDLAPLNRATMITLALAQRALFDVLDVPKEWDHRL
jgi:hypothetical protein